MSRCSVKKLLSQSTEELRREHICVSQNFWYRKNFWIRGRRTEGVSQDNLSFSLSHSTEKLRRGTFLLYTKILVSKYIMDKRWGMKE